MMMMRLFAPAALVALLFFTTTTHGYLLAANDDDAKSGAEELSALESRPIASVSIGGHSATLEIEGAKDSKSGDDAEANATTTTLAPPTTTQSASTEESVTVTVTESPTTITEAPVISKNASTVGGNELDVASRTTTTTTTTTTTEPPTGVNFGVRASIVPPNGGAPVNRVWHFNNQGLNTNSVWFSPPSSSRSVPARASFDTEAVESTQKEVRVQPSSASASPSGVGITATVSASGPASQSVSSAAAASTSNPVFFRRQPVLADEFETSNTLSKRIGTPTANTGASDGVSFGEYRAKHELERNLYYPDISRIQSQSSASASSSAASATSASTTSAAYSTKGGSTISRNQNYWQQSERLQAPVKSIRKVYVGKSGNRLTEEEITQQQQPVRVRVVVQKPTQSAYPGVKAEFTNNYLERLQDASKTNQVSQQQQQVAASSAASASASAGASSFSFGAKSQRANVNEFSATKSVAEEKEYVQVSAKVQQQAGTKSPPPPPPRAPTKSLPPPPPPAPRPAPVKQYPTKTAVKSIVRQPVFEPQQQLSHLEENPEPEPYSFNFNYGDESGNGQFRREEGDRDGVVRGSYGYTDAWGLYRIVDYVADANGFRATIRTNEPGLVQRSPVTNEVENPAHIKVAAEDTPDKVVELMRLTKPKHQL